MIEKSLKKTPPILVQVRIHVLRSIRSPQTSGCQYILIIYYQYILVI